MDNPHPAPSAFLSAGVLTLDTSARTLSGPTGTCVLHGMTYLFLRTLMRQPGQAVVIEQIVAACWPEPALRPAGVGGAVRARAVQVRQAISQVGASRKLLRMVYRGGYLIEGVPRVVRAFTPEQAVAFHQILATHPDAALVAAFAAQASEATL